MRFSAILIDLKEALKAYKDAGLYSVCTEFDFELELGRDLIS
jgi:hypothetical protein